MTINRLMPAGLRAAPGLHTHPLHITHAKPSHSQPVALSRSASVARPSHLNLIPWIINARPTPSPSYLEQVGQRGQAQQRGAAKRQRGGGGHGGDAAVVGRQVVLVGRRIHTKSAGSMVGAMVDGYEAGQCGWVSSLRPQACARESSPPEHGAHVDQHGGHQRRQHRLLGDLRTEL